MSTSSTNPTNAGLRATDLPREPSDVQRAGQAKPPRLRRAGRLAVSAALIAGVSVTLAMVERSVVPFGSNPKRETLALPVVAEPVVIEDGVTVHRSFVGVVEARRESRIGFELGGQVASILVDEGDAVKAGQVLARADTKLLDAERLTLVATRDEVAARLELAHLTRERTRKALAGHAVSRQALDEAVTNFNVLSAALSRAEAAIAQVDARLAKSVLRAPFTGIVAERHFDEGQIAAATAPVITLLEASEPEARIGVSTQALSSLKVGQKLEVTVTGRRVEARVASLLPVRGAKTRTVEVRLVLDGTLHDLRRGDLVTLDLARVRRTRGTWLPLSALTESSRGLWAAYVAVPLHESDGDDLATHRLERRDVEVVHAARERVFVRGALADGEHVVTAGLQRLVPDQRVRLAAGQPPEVTR